jgi:hypothetical protein
MRFFLVGMLLFSLMGCGPYMDVQHDTSVAISEYKTYNFYPTLSTNLSKEETIQVMQIISFQLFKYGYQKSDNPDFYVNFFVEENTYAVPIFETEDEEENAETGDEGEENENQRRTMDLQLVGLDQTLFLDIVDKTNDQLAWTVTISGYLEETPTERKLYEYYTQIFEKAFKKFYNATQ